MMFIAADLDFHLDEEDEDFKQAAADAGVSFHISGTHRRLMTLQSPQLETLLQFVREWWGDDVADFCQK